MDDLLDVLSLDENVSFNMKSYNNVKDSHKNNLYAMPLEKLQEMINQKLNEAKHKYSAVMKYSITTNWSRTSVNSEFKKVMFIQIIFFYIFQNFEITKFLVFLILILKKFKNSKKQKIQKIIINHS